MYYINRLLHKWIGLLIFIQMIFWVLGGLIFVSIPFLPIIKGEKYINLTSYNNNTINANKLVSLNKIINNIPNTIKTDLINIGNQPVFKISTLNNNTYYINALTGKKLSTPTQEDIIAIANSIYKGSGKIKDVSYINNAKATQILFVNELYEKTGLIQVSYDDFLNNRLYFDEKSGEFYKIRNNAWVIYDFFWRLHIMDYKNGENFNNILVIITTTLALILTLSGSIMLFYTRFIKKSNLDTKI